MADNFKTIRCPACNKEMKKVFIPTAGINVDVCINGCGGIYFDVREYNKLDEPHEDASAIFNELANKELNRVDESIKRTCPCCGATMIKNFSSIRREIQIDECYKCGGKFLDGGELEKIRAEYQVTDGRLSGIFREYDRQGRAVVEIPFHQGKADGRGSMRTRGKIVPLEFRNGKYFENGKKYHWHFHSSKCWQQKYIQENRR